MTLRTLAMAALAAMAPLAAARAQARPSTDVWFVTLKGPGIPRVGHAENLTRRVGYDNQPSFTPDGRSILYTRIEGNAPSDVWRIDLATFAQSNVTRTTVESEYSPTPMPDGRHFSTVRVEADSTQRLWRFTLDGTEAPVLLLERIAPVGYHVWASDVTVALYVLGAPLGRGTAAATLQLADVRTGTAEIVARDIGRALQKIPGRAAISYLQQGRDTSWITALDVLTGRSTRIAPAPQRSDYHVWLPDGHLVASADARLLVWVNGRWDVLADLAVDGVRNISRMALSPAGDRLVFVAEDRVSP